MYSLRRTEDIDEVRELHSLTFPLDEWVGDDREFWIARDAGGRTVGFCAATYQPATNIVSLDRAGVVGEAQGAGLQKRMIRARVAWARRIGATGAISYIALRNYQSMVNLLKCGFRFYTSETPHEYEDEESFHFMKIEF